MTDLRTLRKRLGLTQAELAELLQTSQLPKPPVAEEMIMHTRRIMRLLALGAALGALAACASPQEIADADCRSWGAQPGTTAYTQCMSSRVAAIEAGDLAAASMLITTMPRSSSTYCNPAGTACHTY